MLVYHLRNIDKLSISAIAIRMKRDKSTISRELKRNATKMLDWNE